MTSTLEKILSHNANRKVLNFLDIHTKRHHILTPFTEKQHNTHEGLEDFLKFELPTESKYILDNTGIIIIPGTGEIIAFEFGRHDTAFKLYNPNRYRRNFQHIKRGLLRNLKIRGAMRVSLQYFSNIFHHANTIVDIRELGNEWALSIYFVGQTEEMIREYYFQRVNN